MNGDWTWANHRPSRPKHVGWNQGHRWTVATVVMVAMVIYYVYIPVPPGVTEPWKARQAMALLRTIGHVAFFSEKIGLASRFNATRYIVDSLSLIPPKNYQGLKVEDTTFDGVKVRMYVPDGRQNHGPAVIFYHGGGWIMGGVESHDHITSALAQKLQAVVVSVEYRLCPENPYPAPLEDCLRATRYFMEHASQYGVDRTRIAIAGDSAGGNMAAAAVLRLRDTPGVVVQPRLQVLVYPLLQASDYLLPSYVQNDGAVLGTRHEIANVVLLYMGQDDRHAHHLLSNGHLDDESRLHHAALLNVSRLPENLVADYSRPSPGRVSAQLATKVAGYLADPFCMPLVAGDLSRLPETLIMTAQYDVLRDDGALYSERLADAGVPVTWWNYEHSYHGMLAFFDQPLKTEEGSKMMEDLVDYLKVNL